MQTSIFDLQPIAHDYEIELPPVPRPNPDLQRHFQVKAKVYLEFIEKLERSNSREDVKRHEIARLRQMLIEVGYDG